MEQNQKDKQRYRARSKQYKQMLQMQLSLPMCRWEHKDVLKYFTHSHIKVIINYYARQWSRLLCNMMCAPVQCQVWFKTSLMVKHSVKLQHLLFPWRLWWCLIHFIRGVYWVVENNDVLKAFSPLHVATSWELRSLWTDVMFFNIANIFVNMLLDQFYPTFLVCFHRFYSSPYSISTNRMIAQTSITPFIAASPVSTYQVGGRFPKFDGLDWVLRACMDYTNL